MIKRCTRDRIQNRVPRTDPRFADLTGQKLPSLQ